MFGGLGPMKVLNIHFWYDAPQFFSCRSMKDGRLFLALAVEELPNSARWLYLPVSEPRLCSIEAGDLTPYLAFKLAENGEVYEAELFNDGAITVRPLTASKIPDEDLPAPDVCLA